MGSFYEQRRPVIPMLSAMKRSTKLSKEQVALRQAWDNMEGRVSCSSRVNVLSIKERKRDRDVCITLYSVSAYNDILSHTVA